MRTRLLLMAGLAVLLVTPFFDDSDRAADAAALYELGRV